MIIETITQTRAKELTGVRLPAGLRWYWVSEVQFYPRYGDFKHLWAADTGLEGVIGSRKRELALQHGAVERDAGAWMREQKAKEGM